MTEAARAATLAEELSVTARWHNQRLSPMEEKVISEACAYLESMSAAPVAPTAQPGTPLTDAAESEFMSGRSLSWLEVAAKSHKVFAAMRTLERQLAQARREIQLLKHREQYGRLANPPAERSEP